MSEWFCSNVAYAAIPLYIPGGTYSPGAIFRPTSTSANARFVFTCISVGSSGNVTNPAEPSWPPGNNSTVTSASAPNNSCTFQNITGQGTFGWGGASGDLGTLINQGALGQRALGGDTIYLAADHSEASSQYFTSITSSNITLKLVSVDPDGDVPPVPDDLLAGANIGDSSSVIIVDRVPLWMWGITLSGQGLNMGGAVAGTGRKIRMDDCELSVVGGVSASRINTNSGGPSVLILNNTGIRFSHTSQGFNVANYAMDVIWSDTAQPILGSFIPDSLFLPTGSTGDFSAICRGLDLSLIVGSLMTSGASTDLTGKFLFEGCKLSPAVTPLGSPATGSICNQVDLVNCFDGATALSGRYSNYGSCTVNRSRTLRVNPSSDENGAYSFSLTSNANANGPTQVVEAFPLDIGISELDSPLSATVEIVASSALNNDQVVMTIEYMGTAGSTETSFVTTAPETILTTPSAIPESVAEWNNPPIGNATQKLVAFFIPKYAGRCRIMIYLAVANTTVYINGKPRIVRE